MWQDGIRPNLYNNWVAAVKAILLWIKWLCYPLFVSHFMIN